MRLGMSAAIAKGTTGDFTDERRHDAGNNTKLSARCRLARKGNTVDQAACIGMSRITEDIGCPPLLYDLAGIHDRNLICYTRHDTQIMRDKNNRYAQFLAKLC